MKLYDHPQAPNTRRVRVFLAEKGIEVPTETVDLGTGANREPAYLAINPAGTVPVLELDDGTRIAESVAICRYFETVRPDPPLMGTDARDRALVEMHHRYMELHGMAPAGEMLRNGSPHFENRALAGPHPFAQIPELVERGRTRLGLFFARLEEILADREFVAGPRYTIADIAALVTVDFARWSKMAPEPGQTRIAAWYERVSARPSAKA